jgi:shikimate 5-dehydrogenase
MTIYLRHPVHGTKVATMDLEAQFDEQNGWKRYNIDTPDIKVEVVEVTDEPVIEIDAEEALAVNTLKKTRRKIV